MFARSPMALVPVLLLASATDAWAESLPSLEDLVPQCRLIARCRAVEVDGVILSKVGEVLHGRYSPLDFGSTPTGYLDVDAAAGQRVAGEQAVLLYFQPDRPDADQPNSDQPSKKTPQRPPHPDLILPIDNGWIVWPQTLPPTNPKSYLVKEFVQQVRRISRLSQKESPKQVADQPMPTAPAEPLAPPAAALAGVDLSGRWRMFLPEGFEWEVTLKGDVETGYRLEPGSFCVTGRYRVAGNHLVLTEPSEPHLAGFEWEIRSPWMMTLVKEPGTTGSSYLGAVLFRPSHVALQRQDAAAGASSPSVED